MKINEFAKRSGVPAKTIRYYETVGLLPEPARRANGYRDYDDRDLERLIFVRRCRELQIPLNQLKKLVSVQADPRASCADVDEIINDKLAKVRALQRELALLEETLGQLSLACHHNQIRDCAILRRLKCAP